MSQGRTLRILQNTSLCSKQVMMRVTVFYFSFKLAVKEGHVGANLF